MKNSKRSLVLIAVVSLVIICPNALFAQEKRDAFELYRQQMNDKFEETRRAHDKRFNHYRDSINNVYVECLKREWEQSSLHEGLPAPSKPEPKPVADTAPVEVSRPLPHTEPVAEEIPISRPEPKEPIVPDKPISNTHSFSFFGARCEVHIPASGFRLKDASNDSVVEGWNHLSSGSYDQFLADCLSYREGLNLCDWGVYQFILIFSESFFGDADCNEAVMFRMYSLSQLGYKVRLCSQGSRLINLIAVSQQVYAVPYVEIDDALYYNLSSTAGEGGLRVCDFAFPGERSASLHIASLPQLPYAPSAERCVQSVAFPLVKVSVRVNKNLIDFLATYPGCSWELFTAPSLSREVKEQLYSLLREKVAGKSERDAANLLLNFVQTGFDYKTDKEQFGREKTLFGDESFYYPYCDCEDRSVLFAILIRDILGLDVVLLDYPSHIATAVQFNESVEGDYFDIAGKRYVICDPTYIGAPIGKSMPEMSKLKANILRIK